MRRPKQTAQRWAAALWCGMAALVPLPVLSADVQALVVGQSAPSAPRAFGDAFHASKALKSGGFGDVQLLRDAPFETVMSALMAMEAGTPAVIYLTGPLTEDGGGIRLSDTALMFEDVVTALAEADLKDVALLVEGCSGNGVPVRLPAVPEGMQMLRASSTPPGEPCTEGTKRLTDALKIPVNEPTSLQKHLADVWISSNGEADLVLRPRPLPNRGVTSFTAAVVPTAAPLLQAGVVSITPLNATAMQNAVISPVSLPAPPRAQSGEVVIFAPPPQAQLAALPLAEGLPQPSIIVGIIKETDPEAFARVSTPGDVSSTAISYENLEARRALRAQDPTLFGELVASGAFDPPSPLLAVALQTELARMGCYRAGIDGDWGRGSRASVERYFDEIDGAEAVTLDASVSLFRQIVLQDDVTCAAPVAAAAAPRATQARAQRTTRTTTQRQTPRRTTRQSAPAPQQRAPALSNANRLGGVFR